MNADHIYKVIEDAMLTCTFDTRSAVTTRT